MLIILGYTAQPESKIQFGSKINLNYSELEECIHYLWSELTKNNKIIDGLRSLHSFQSKNSDGRI